MTRPIEPVEIVSLVEEYVRSELHDAEQYDNRTPLDESGIWVYAAGFDAGQRATEERERHVQSRAER